MSRFREFIDTHAETIVERYLERVYQTVKRYGEHHPETFPANTRRLVALLPTARENPDAPEINQFVDDLVQQRLPMGFMLTDILEAMFLYDDVILPMIWEEVDVPQDRQLLAADLQNAIEAVALRFARTFVELQLQMVERQRQAMLELSTPVIKVWDGILALPLIGTIDSYRARQIMESLLTAVSAQQASIVLLDITGVPIVDTNVADHLIKTIRAASLLGAECLLVGIKPDLAQTLVSLGINLGNIISAADLRQGLALAFGRLGLVVVRREELQR